MRKTLPARAYGARTPGQTLARTSPIYVGRRTPPSARDASFFVTWIDELLADAGGHPDRYPSPQDHAEAMNAFRAARHVYADRVAQGSGPR